MFSNWKVFNNEGLHFLHLNVNSLPSKIDEIKMIALKSNATIIGITETKLDNTIKDSEVNIDGYEIIRSDRNRHGGGVACYIKKNWRFNIKENVSSDFENIFLDILLPNSKPILISMAFLIKSLQKFQKWKNLTTKKFTF